MSKDLNPLAGICFVCFLAICGRDPECICRLSSHSRNNAPYPGSGRIMCYPLRKTNPHQRVRGRKRKGGADIETGGEFSCDRKCKQSSGDWQGQYSVSASGWLTYLENTRLDSSKTHHPGKLSLLYATQVFATSDRTTDFWFN